jgi:serine/threonine protein kinase
MMGDAIDSDEPDTKSIYYRRVTISCSQGAAALPFDDLSGVSPPSAFSSYRVLHQIGSGVLGPVFRSHDATGQRLVAIKALKLDLVPEDAARLAEALRTIAGRAQGVPGLVTTLDCGTERGTAFLALEYVSGDALDVHLRQPAVLPLADVQRLLVAIAGTIDAAWQQGVSHGALHPRDIFLGATAGHVTITGFGVAQALEQVGARTPVRLPYSAPERIAGAEWDRRADIYALGAIAHEITARAGVGDVPAAWKAAMARATSDEPAARFDTALAFAGALSHVSVALPLSPQPIVSPSTRMPAAMEIDMEAPVALDRMRNEPAMGATPVIDLPVAPADRWPSRDRESAAILPASPERFPWAATAAIGIAGVALGLVAGYYWGAAQARDTATAPVSSIASAGSAPQVRTPMAEPPLATPPAEAGASETGVRPALIDRPTPPQVPAATRGSLLVDSRPQKASVIMDGRAAGQTPLVIEQLSPGMHSVLIQLKGHRPVPSKVAIVAGEQAKLAVSLERLAVMAESLPRKSR